MNPISEKMSPETKFLEVYNIHPKGGLLIYGGKKRLLGLWGKKKPN